MSTIDCFACPMLTWITLHQLQDFSPKLQMSARQQRLELMIHIMRGPMRPHEHSPRSRLFEGSERVNELADYMKHVQKKSNSFSYRSLRGRSNSPIRQR